MAPILFYALAVLTCGSAWAIVFQRNIVRMSVYLLFTLAGAAGLYFVMDAELLAALQLIVYTGGTLILIIFGVMLTSRAPFLAMRSAKWELRLAVVVGGVLAAGLLLAVLASPVGPETGAQAAAMQAAAARAGASQTQPQAPAVAPLGGARQVEWVGRGLLTTYLVPFEVVAVLLLVVMIGAAFMARKRAEGQGPRA